MNVLIACETSGIVRRSFAIRGHHAVSVDLLPSEDMSSDHVIGDALDLIHRGEWDLLIAHPPCTYLSVSGLHWNHRRPERAEMTEEALDFVRQLLQAPVPRIALENPVSAISSRIRKPDQIIQPYQYGHDASKRTCLWLKNLPLLQATSYIEPRLVNGKARWGNQTDSGQNRLGPSPNRWKERSRTYQGIAEAMAEQWGNLTDGSVQPADSGGWNR